MPQGPGSEREGARVREREQESRRMKEECAGAGGTRRGMDVRNKPRKGTHKALNERKNAPKGDLSSKYFAKKEKPLTFALRVGIAASLGAPMCEAYRRDAGGRK